MKLREQAYESFTRALLSLDLRAGQFVSQRELVALTAMPLGAIRELIPRLEADGLIRTVPQRGMQIANVDLKLIRNAFQLRMILEREAAVQFAASASAETIEGLAEAHQDIVVRAEKKVTPTLLREAQEVDWRLHDLIIDSMGNEIVSEIYRVNSIKIRLIRLERVLLNPEVLLPAMREHLSIIDAFRTRDPVAVGQAMEHHLTHARNRALGVA
jgi:DNA-binding GntR family transcriptional regulator